MATKLSLYNAALREIGDAKLSSVTEAVEARYVLDDVYEDVVKDCIESGLWNFATRSVKLDADTGIEPGFGPSEVFAKPSDFVRVVAISPNGDFLSTVSDYIIENEYLVAHQTPIYVRYISDGDDYGFDLTNWPRSFTRYVELSLALRVCERLTQSAGKAEQLRLDVKAARMYAKSRDAMDEAQPRYTPMGSWNAARTGRSGDRGSRDRLTG